MLKFSKKVEYALISLIYMAEREADALTTSRELAQIFNFPQELIGKVLQSLARGSYVRSMQGVRGGYQLVSKPENIRLTQVITAVDGPISVVNCLNNNGDCHCDQLDYCNIRNPMEKLQLKLLEALHEITLKDLQDNTISFSKAANGEKSSSFDQINFNVN